MADGVNVKMGVSGLNKFKQDIKQAQESVKTYDAELKLAEKQLQATGDREAYMQQKTKLLQQQIAAQNNVIKQCQQALTAMEKQGINPASQAYQQMQQRLLNAESALIDMRSSLDNVGDAANDTAQKTDKLADSLNSINKKVSFDAVINGIGKITDGMEAAARRVGALARDVWDTMALAASWADNENTLAAMYGLDVETLQRMQGASRTIDTSVESIVKSRQKLKQNMASDSQEIAEAFDKLGVSIGEVNGNTGIMGKLTEFAAMFTGRELNRTFRSWEDVFWDTGDALLKYGDEVERDVLAQRIFGRSWMELMPMFQAGREKYEKTLDEQSIVTQQNVDKLNALDDALQRLDQEYQTTKYTLLSELAPAFTTVGDTLTGLIGKFNEYLQTEEGQEKLEGLSQAVTELFSGLSDADFGAAIDTASGILTTIKESLFWIADNKKGLVTAITAIGGAFLGLKAAQVVGTLAQSVTALKSLLGGTPGASSADMAKSAADAAKSAEASAAAASASSSKAESAWKNAAGSSGEVAAASENAAGTLAAGGEEAAGALTAGGTEAAGALAAGGTEAAGALTVGGAEAAAALAAGGAEASSALAAGGAEAAGSLSTGGATAAAAIRAAATDAALALGSGAGAGLLPGAAGAAGATGLLTGGRLLGLPAGAAGAAGATGPTWAAKLLGAAAVIGALGKTASEASEKLGTGLVGTMQRVQKVHDELTKTMVALDEAEQEAKHEEEAAEQRREVEVQNNRRRHPTIQEPVQLTVSDMVAMGIIASSEPTQKQQKAAEGYWDFLKSHGFMSDATMDAAMQSYFADQPALLDVLGEAMLQMINSSAANGVDLPEDLPEGWWLGQDGLKVNTDPVLPEDTAERLQEQLSGIELQVGVVPALQPGGGGFGDTVVPMMHALDQRANGLPFVPFDGYIAALHKGERIVPANQNKSYSANSNLYVEKMYMNNGQDAQGLAAAMAAENRRIRAGFGS